MLVCYRCPRARDLAGGGPPAREEKHGEAVWPAGLSIAPEKLVCRGFRPSEVLTSHAVTKGEGRRQDGPVTGVWWAPGVISCSSSGGHLRLPCDLLFINMCLSFPICDLGQEGKAAIPTSQGCCGDRSATLVKDSGAWRSQRRPRAGRGLSPELHEAVRARCCPGRSGFVSNKVVFDGE